MDKLIIQREKSFELVVTRESLLELPKDYLPIHENKKFSLRPRLVNILVFRPLNYTAVSRLGSKSCLRLFS